MSSPISPISAKETVATAFDALEASGIVLCLETAEYLRIADMSPPPTDATVDFPLILDAVGKPEYEHLLTEAAAYGTTQARLDLDDEELRAHAKETKVNLAMNRLLALLGSEILRTVPGHVSIPLDPRLFIDKRTTDTQNLSAPHCPSSLTSETPDSAPYSADELASVLSCARALLAENDALDLPRSRILVQIPATPLGMAVGHALEAAGAHANMTLVGSVAQALACVQAGAALVSLSTDDSQLVKRVLSDLTGAGHTATTRVMACGFSSVDRVLSLTPRTEGSTTGMVGDTVSMVALTPEMMKSLHETPHSSATSPSTANKVDSGSVAYISDGDLVASPLPEYFSTNSGRTTVDYARALVGDHLAMEMLEPGLVKHSTCAQMVEELLMAELDRVSAVQCNDTVFQRDESVADTTVIEDDITSVEERLQGTALSPDESPSSADGDPSHLSSASTSELEDVDLHTPLTNSSSCTSQSSDAATQDITDAGDDSSTRALALSAEYSVSHEGGEEQPIELSKDVSETTSTMPPIPEREKPRMSVKARVMEIEARLEKDKEVGGPIAESGSSVSVSA